MAAKPVRVREYPPLKPSLTNSSLSVMSVSVALSWLRLGPEKHNIWPGTIRNRRKARSTRCSDVDNKILSRMQSLVAFRDQGAPPFLGQLSPAEGVTGTACPSVCAFFLRRRFYSLFAFLFFSKPTKALYTPVSRPCTPDPSAGSDTVSACWIHEMNQVVEKAACSTRPFHGQSYSPIAAGGSRHQEGPSSR